MSHWGKGRFNRATLFQISLFFKNKNSRKHFRILEIEQMDKYLEPFAFQHQKKKSRKHGNTKNCAIRKYENLDKKSFNKNGLKYGKVPSLF